MAYDKANTKAQAGGARTGARSSARPTGGGKHWTWFISGLLTGACGVVIAYFAYLHSQGDDTALDSAINSVANEAKETAVNFDFYKELPAAEVAVTAPPAAEPVTSASPTAITTPTAATAPTSAAASVDTNTRFLLQAGSFEQRTEAEARRAKITLLNMSADIAPGVVSGRTVYRVQVGPVTGREAANNARANLSASNIASIVLQMR